jgi:hypothetical protein
MMMKHSSQLPHGKYPESPLFEKSFLGSLYVIFDDPKISEALYSIKKMLSH